MQERLLQYIWQYQYYNHRQLQTAGGEPLQILAPGILNKGQGPDFMDARIRIGNALWAGNIELHIRNSDWDRHAHQGDKFYRNVILHVVWEDDVPALKREDRSIPLLILQHRVPKWLLGQYEQWMQQPSFIPCEGQLNQVEPAIWAGWTRSLLEQRLQHRSSTIRSYLKDNRHHWEETLWWLLARNFGLPVNGAAFEAIARSLPLRILARHQGRVDQLEALLLGQAGLLEEPPTDDYGCFLQQEYHHLRHKYPLPAIYTPVLFLRMRPGNFPAVRLAQLAALLSRSVSWFTRVKEAETPAELRALLEVRTAGYWDDHYVLGIPSEPKIKGLGTAMQDSIMINSLIPMLYAYGSFYREETLVNRSIKWLEELKAEKNAQIAAWGRLGVPIKNAADTQSLMELKKNYCEPKKCLDCAVGKRILSGGAPDPSTPISIPTPGPSPYPS